MTLKTRSHTPPGDGVFGVKQARLAELVLPDLKDVVLIPWISLAQDQSEFYIDSSTFFISLPPEVQMPSNRELIKSLYDAFAKGDAATVLGAMHPEVEWKEAENSPYADQNPYVGPDRVGAGVFGRLMADFEGFTVTPLKLVAEGDTVVALGRYTGTSKGSNKRLDAQFAHAWTVRDGKVTDFQQYTDTAQYQQLLAT